MVFDSCLDLAINNSVVFLCDLCDCWCNRDAQIIICVWTLPINKKWDPPVINAFNKIFVFSFDLVIISNFNVYAIVNTIKFEKRQLIDEKIAFRSDTNAYALHFSNFAK